jgi:hypothetical protein
MADMDLVHFMLGGKKRFALKNSSTHQTSTYDVSELDHRIKTLKCIDFNQM